MDTLSPIDTFVIGSAIAILAIGTSGLMVLFLIAWKNDNNFQVLVVRRLAATLVFLTGIAWLFIGYWEVTWASLLLFGLLIFSDLLKLLEDTPDARKFVTICIVAVASFITMTLSALVSSGTGLTWVNYLIMGVTIVTSIWGIFLKELGDVYRR